jgi:hypothetical protein
MDITEKMQLHAMVGSGLQDTVNNLEYWKKRLSNRLRVLSRQLREEKEIDNEKLNEYVEVNKNLRLVKIWEAEFSFIKYLI